MTLRETLEEIDPSSWCLFNIEYIDKKGFKSIFTYESSVVSASFLLYYLSGEMLMKPVLRSIKPCDYYGANKYKINSRGEIVKVDYEIYIPY